MTIKLSTFKLIEQMLFNENMKEYLKYFLLLECNILHTKPQKIMLNSQ